MVTFRSTAEAVLHDFYKEKRADEESEKIRVVDTAAKLIRNDIKAIETLMPSCQKLDRQYQMFLWL